jgi:surfactin synthase thioesterase subunit/glycosyltransferase involved in cell wall biosynthesis
VRILLAHNSLYYPSHGGGDKSNRLLMEALASRGHSVRVVARTRGASDQFQLGGVDIRALTFDGNLRAYFQQQIEEFDPDIILTSTDDPGQLLFDIAIHAPRARVVHLVRATIAVPFGPDSSMPNRAKTAKLRAADAIVGVSEYVAGYVREYGAMDASHVPISLMEPGEHCCVGAFENPFVTMVNPCAVKGIDIFVELAARMPQLRFAAVPTWGTNAEDLALLRSRPNITLLDPVDDIDLLLRQTRVVLVPSVWAEARSRIVVEAMLRGVPVIASDAGGICEAKMGVPHLIPVNLIRQYRPSVDENMVPVAERPAQDTGPWEAALARLTSDRAHWEEISQQSRTAALGYAANLTVEPFERLLLKTLERPKKSVTRQASDARLRLAALILKQRRWFPMLTPLESGKLRLFCFPFAGGGTLPYRSWAGLIPGVDVCPVQLPGRENRSGEPPIDDMSELVEALAAAIQPYTGEPYAFFGHSMGAGIAFELARVLKVPPQILIASSARAPQFRLNQAPTPDPADEELLEQLSRLEGAPVSVLEIALPLLRADTRLYRNYRFHPGPPLSIPLAVYGGDADPNLGPKELEPWRELTRGRFVRREFHGGHFYLQTNTPELLSAIARDLAGNIPG